MLWLFVTGQGFSFGSGGRGGVVVVGGATVLRVYVYVYLICKLISNFRILIKVWNSISLKKICY